MAKRALLGACFALMADASSVYMMNGGYTVTGIETTSSDPRLEGDAKIVKQYIGIPFAEPPIGYNRFRAPKPPKMPKRGSVQNYTEPKPPCFTGKDGTSEDCLYLNLFVPGGLRWNDYLPVMVWFHGGGFTAGRTDIYNATELAARNRVVVVVAAYRLGMLGCMIFFIFHDQFFSLVFASDANLKEDKSTGNWGLMDQRAALRWVRDNIDRFHGDTKKVVIFGQSAGAFSVAAHLVSQSSHGLFHAAIMSSPTVHSSYFFQSKEDSFAFSDWAAKTLAGCKDGNDMDCLRAVPVSRLVVEDVHRDIDSPPHASRLFPMMPWGLTIDGVALTGTPLDLARAGKAAKVPVIVGITQDEGSIFALALGTMIRPAIRGDIPSSIVRSMVDHLLGDPALSEKLMQEFAANSVPHEKVEEESESPKPSPEQMEAIANQLLAEFTAIHNRDIADMSLEEFRAAIPTLQLIPPQTKKKAVFDKNPFLFFVKALRDSLFACPSMDFAEALSSHNPGSVFMYNFALDVWADTPWESASLADGGVPSGGNLTFKDLGAFHGAEIPFIFNMFPDKNLVPTDLSNPHNLFAAYTNKNFCPADSFKREVADKMSCLWTNMGKCGQPQCEDNDCAVEQSWEAWKSLSHHMDIHSRGEFTMRFTHTSFPSAQECRKWHDRRVPFHNFHQGLNKTQPLSSMYAEASRGAGTRTLTGLLVIVIAVLLAF